MLDFIAEPVSLWALGLIGSLVRGVLRSSEETGKRVMPWDWIMDHPGKATSSVVGSIIMLAMLQRAEMLDGSGIMPALLAFGAGALGPEALPIALDKGREAVKKVLNR